MVNCDSNMWSQPLSAIISCGLMVFKDPFIGDNTGCYHALRQKTWRCRSGWHSVWTGLGIVSNCNVAIGEKKRLFICSNTTWTNLKFRFFNSQLIFCTWRVYFKPKMIWHVILLLLLLLSLVTGDCISQFTPTGHYATNLNKTQSKPEVEYFLTVCSRNARVIPSVSQISQLYVNTCVCAQVMFVA